ncbi:eukaryotic translation initiation factor 3 subunit B-like [Saccoglossus kowalevskii]|uniref:Eukaryotic translation initiation factor 3 subunit B n=1 Tax=Saccoglossus kowalevskii TaxID=10224 RepID=A0ABM0GSN6_SACKO|nr:PREDICTED: eukaryotic translation initiation factor 3 subunit B-like [Saccoglossus kowalevskii]
MAEGGEQKEKSGSSKADKSKENANIAASDNSYDEEPDFSDPEDFVDDISEEELMSDLLSKRPKEADGIDSVIVVDNIPQVGTERLEKLQNVIRKIFSKYGKIITEHYPKQDGKTKGYIFLEYTSPANASDAVKNLSGYKLDKQHTFVVNLFTDFEKYASIPDEWEPPQKQPYKDHGNLRSWLLDTDCNDQYSVIYDGGERTTIFMNTGTDQVAVEERARWTETYVRWSPKGTYLATFHQRGIALWGGENFVQIMRFSHPGVQLIDFSPCERYMVTFSPLVDKKEDPQAIIIWDIRTGAKRRGFHCENAAQWPIFKWSHDGKYFTRMAIDSLSVYEVPSFGLLDKKSIKIEDIRDFSWSPSDYMLAYWTPENSDIPARVTLLEIPSRKEVRVKNLFNVAECKMHWQNKGDLLCVKVDRYTKSKKVQFCNFEIFRIREKQIPVEQVEIKESIMAFAWEPGGTKFAILHGENPRISASFYLVTKGKVELQKVMDKKVANHIFWSPNGQFIVLAGLRSMSGALEFIDTSDYTLMNSAEHFMATDLKWDPTGRYVVSGVRWWGHKVDNAYWVWSFQGRLLHKQTLDRFCQLLWRPRPPTLLSQNKLREIKKNMKSYNKQFELKDRMSQSKASKELIEKRHQLMEEFRKYRREVEDVYDDNKLIRLELRNGIDTDEFDSHVDECDEEVIEFLVKETTEIIDE